MMRFRHQVGAETVPGPASAAASGAAAPCPGPISESTPTVWGLRRRLPASGTAAQHTRLLVFPVYSTEKYTYPRENHLGTRCRALCKGRAHVAGKPALASCVRSTTLGWQNRIPTAIKESNVTQPPHLLQVPAGQAASHRLARRLDFVTCGQPVADALFRHANQQRILRCNIVQSLWLDTLDATALRNSRTLLTHLADRPSHSSTSCWWQHGGVDCRSDKRTPVAHSLHKSTMHRKLVGRHSWLWNDLCVAVHVVAPGAERDALPHVASDNVNRAWLQVQPQPRDGRLVNARRLHRQACVFAR